MHAGASEPRAEREGAIPADAPARRQSVRKSTWMRSLSHVNATQQTFPIWRNVNTQECSLARSLPIHWRYESRRRHPSHADADLYDICSNSFVHYH